MSPRALRRALCHDSHINLSSFAVPCCCVATAVRRESSTNRLLRAKTESSAAIVVDGPFSKLQAYMTLPVSEYSLLDSSIIRRVSETSFRFQVFYALCYIGTEFSIWRDTYVRAAWG